MTPARDAPGFGLVPAIFLLVVLSLAGVVMLRLVGVSAATASLSLRGARAFQAARSGVEWGTREVTLLGACPATTTLALTQGGLAGFSVVVSCTSSQHVDSAATTTNFQISSSASAGVFGARDYVSRRVRGTVTNAP
ncbi:MAG TPA: pilus assembly protein MshP [Myxococcota bacterium]|nr:pilus assembly protein MshP [Myxococcota bacterium]